MGLLNILDCSADLANCCNDAGMVIFLNIFRRIIDLIQLIVPILLILFATIQFSKLVMDPDMKDGMKRVKNLFVAGAIIFFIPVIVDAVLGLLPQSFSISACWTAANISVSNGNQNYSLNTDNYINKNSDLVVDDEKNTTNDDSKNNNSNNSNNNSSINTNNDNNNNDNDNSSNSGGSSSSIEGGSAKGILEGAAKVHAMYEREKWVYYSSGSQLRWNNIKYSTNNPSKRTCCATFVGSAFYVGGVFPESVLNKYNYNSQLGISKLCKDYGWIKITSYNQLKAGDIVIMSGPNGGSVPKHVQIYAGNGTWYNAGSTKAIQRSNPYSSNAKARFLYAWRKP